MVFNLGGGSRVTLNKVLSTLEEISKVEVRRQQLPSAPGDPRHTGASINLARERLGWEPRVSLRDGLTKQWTWYQDTRSGMSASASRPND
jgi:UDP-glucose 4-epimerase